jgi:hypothetical protein
MTIIESLAAYGAQLSTAPLSPAVLHHAKRAVIDWYAALLPGAVCEPPTLLEQALADDLDDFPCDGALELPLPSCGASRSCGPAPRAASKPPTANVTAIQAAARHQAICFRFKTMVSPREKSGAL